MSSDREIRLGAPAARYERAMMPDALLTMPEPAVAAADVYNRTRHSTNFLTGQRHGLPALLHGGMQGAHTSDRSVSSDPGYHGQLWLTRRRILTVHSPNIRALRQEP
jgi:hypothetical protein